MHVGTSEQFCLHPKPYVKPVNRLLSASFTVAGFIALTSILGKKSAVKQKAKAGSGYAHTTNQQPTTGHKPARNWDGTTQKWRSSRLHQNSVLSSMETMVGSQWDWFQPLNSMDCHLLLYLSIFHSLPCLLQRREHWTRRQTHAGVAISVDDLSERATRLNGIVSLWIKFHGSFQEWNALPMPTEQARLYLVWHPNCCLRSWCVPKIRASFSGNPCKNTKKIQKDCAKSWPAAGGCCIGEKRLILFPKQCVQTEGFLCYSKCEGRCLIRVLTLGPGSFPVNFGTKWLLWNLDMRFD